MANKGDKILRGGMFLIQILIMSLLFKSSNSQEIRRSLRVASDLKPRFLTKFEGNGGSKKFRGFVKDFLEELLIVMGYDYEIKLAQDHRPSVSVGVNFTSGYWDGVIGMLVRNVMFVLNAMIIIILIAYLPIDIEEEADLAFGETEATMERTRVVDFSVPVLTTRFSILHKHQHAPRQTVTHNQWTIFAPFSTSVWIPFAVVTLLYIAFLKAQQIRIKSKRFRFIQKLKHSKKFAGIILTVWTFLLFTSYISNYTAQKVLAAVSTKAYKFSGLLDISSQKDIKIGWMAHGPVEGFFRNTNNEMYQKIYIRNIGRDWISSVKEGVNKVLQDDGKFAFILDSLTANHEAQLDCSLYTLPQEFGQQHSIAVATPLGSPLRERINQAVLYLSEQGIIETLQLRWFAFPQVNRRCSLKTVTNNASIDAGVQEMSPIFIIAVLGLFLATTIALWEMHSLNKNQKPTSQPKPPRQRSELIPKFNLEVV